MQDSLKYLCPQFGYERTKNKEMVKGVISKKPNPCRINNYTIIANNQQ